MKHSKTVLRIVETYKRRQNWQSPEKLFKGFKGRSKMRTKSNTICFCPDVNLGRKRARRTPKPIVAETKPGRRWKFSLKISDNILVNMMNIESTFQTKFLLIKRTLFAQKKHLWPVWIPWSGGSDEHRSWHWSGNFAFDFWTSFQKSFSSSFFFGDFSIVTWRV